MFRLKDKSALFGIDKDTSTDSTPVFKKNLEDIQKKIIKYIEKNI